MPENPISDRSSILIVTAFLALGLFLVPSGIEAHPPENMELRYDFASEVLNITITHTTPATSQHYVESVEVFRNDISVIDETYTDQPTVRVFYLEFEVPAQDGDVLRVKAMCNLWGELEENITVDGPKDRMRIEVNPAVDEMEMGEEQDFTVNIWSSAEDPLEGVTVKVTAWLGAVSEVSDLGLGGYSFTYTAPDLDDEDVEVINISASKNGFHKAYLEFDIDILEPADPDKIIEVTLSPKFSTIEEGESRDITVTVEAGGNYLDIDDIRVERSGGTYSTLKTDVGTFVLTFKASEVTTDRQGWIKVTAEMEGYRSGSQQMSFTIKDRGTTDDDDEISDPDEEGFFNTTTIAILVLIVLIIAGLVIFILYRRRKKV